MRLLTDENFNGSILRGLIRRLPKLDVVRIQDVNQLTQVSLQLLTLEENIGGYKELPFLLPQSPLLWR